MTSEKQYKPGTVAVATVSGVPDVRVMRKAGGDDWSVSTGGMTRRTDELTDIRPLVVLDLGGLVDPERLVASLRHSTICGSVAIADAIADQIEAQTKPPRIPEPGLFGVVEAETLLDPFRSVYFNTARGWRAARDGAKAQWSDLIDPTVIRDGVQS